MNLEIITPDSQETESTTVEIVETTAKVEAEVEKTFTQEEVNELISKRVNKNNEEIETLKKTLTTYKEQDHEKVLSKGFDKLNGSKKRFGDFAKLVDIDSDASVEDVVAKATEMKQSGKYDFLFNKGNSGAVKDIDKKKPKIDAANIRVKQGLG